MPSIQCPSISIRKNGTSIFTLESIMSRSITNARHQAFINQSHHCFYCCVPIWEHSPVEFISKYQVTRFEAELFRCIAEHLLPRSEGGLNIASNIVAACWFCNRTRHKARTPLEPVAYRHKVRSRVLKGRWLPSSLSLRLRVPTSNKVVI